MAHNPIGTTNSLWLCTGHFYIHMLHSFTHRSHGTTAMCRLRLVFFLVSHFLHGCVPLVPTLQNREDSELQ